MKKFLITTALILSTLLPVGVSSATSFLDIFDSFEKGIEEQSGDVIEQGAKPIVLPTYADPKNPNATGADNLLNALQNILSFLKLIVAPISLIVIFVLAIRMVAAGRENEEVTTKAKTYATYALEGFIMIMLADTLVNVFFGSQGEIFRQGEAGATEFARRASRFLEGAYGLIEVVIAGISVFVLITAGMRYVVGSYDDDQISTAKRQITWAMVGLFVIGISEFVVKEILFPNQGTTLGISQANQLFAQVTNFITGTMGTISFIALLYAGGLYVTARDNEDNVSKAKTIMMGAAIGIIIALSAFALTNTIVNLDATR